jgi:hypothetical protein
MPVKVAVLEWEKIVGHDGPDLFRAPVNRGGKTVGWLVRATEGGLTFVPGAEWTLATRDEMTPVERLKAMNRGMAALMGGSGR